MSFRQYQPNFSRGELAPQLYGRFDVEAWQSAVRQARNVFILKYGGLSKRPGTQLVAEVLDDSADTRLIPFQFSLTQTYVLEMGQGYMSPCANGGRVVEAELAITGITNAANAALTVAYHGYAVGNRLYISGVEGEMGDYLNGLVWTVTAVTDDATFEIDADTSTLAAFTAAAGGITRTVAADPDPTPPTVPDPVPDPDPPSTIGGIGDWIRYDLYL